VRLVWTRCEDVEPVDADSAVTLLMADAVSKSVGCIRL
jgi:hypothetical protein